MAKSCDKMRIYVSGEGYARSMSKYFTTLESDPVFNTGLNWNDYANMSMEEYRQLQTKRARSLPEYQFIENEDILENPACPAAYTDANVYLEWSSGMKYFLNRSVYYISLSRMSVCYYAYSC